MMILFFIKEIKLLDKLNKFNKYHACYIRKTYNDDIYPDSKIYLNDEKCEDYDYTDASMAELYNAILKDIEEITELFKDSKGNTDNIAMGTLQQLQEKNIEMKLDLEVKMKELKGDKVLIQN